MALAQERRAALHRRVRFIVVFTITCNVIEAIIALTAGAVASSAALIGFGLDSVIAHNKRGANPPTAGSGGTSCVWWS